jgi:hypothetical protein
VDNIYVCIDLGAPGDEDCVGSESAHWWRRRLAKESGCDQRAWGVLRIDLDDLPRIRLLRDFWSYLGLIVRGVEAIPKEFIEVAYVPE